MAGSLQVAHTIWKPSTQDGECPNTSEESSLLVDEWTGSRGSDGGGCASREMNPRLGLVADLQIVVPAYRSLESTTRVPS
jgi:hypothetical protein